MRAVSFCVLQFWLFQNLQQTSLCFSFSFFIDDKRKTKLLWILAIVGAVAAVVVAAHYIFKFFAPDYMDDFEDEFEDEFDDDFFDDEDDEYEEED